MKIHTYQDRNLLNGSFQISVAIISAVKWFSILVRSFYKFWKSYLGKCPKIGEIQDGHHKNNPKFKKKHHIFGPIQDRNMLNGFIDIYSEWAMQRKMPLNSLKHTTSVNSEWSIKIDKSSIFVGQIWRSVQPVQLEIPITLVEKLQNKLMKIIWNLFLYGCKIVILLHSKFRLKYKSTCHACKHCILSSSRSMGIRRALLVLNVHYY